jgi:hypothetical protein
LRLPVLLATRSLAMFSTACKEILMIRTSSHTARILAATLVLLGALLSANLLGCGSTSISPIPTAIGIQGPKSTSVDPGDSATYTAAVSNDANNAGVTWTLAGTACTGAACGALSNSSTTGVTYTAPATVATAFTVTITVTSVASPSLTAVIPLSIPANPSIATTAGALAGGIIGTPYSVALAGAGGITPFAWSITKGALPAGLALNATTGVISGIPTAPGSASFTVTLTDSGSPALTAAAAYTLAVAYSALTISTATLPGGTAGTAYTAALAASGGTGTGYTWSVTSGTGLSAAGLSLTPAGVLTGTPSAAETAAPFTVKVTDSYGDTASATLALTIVYPAITIAATPLPSGTYGVPYAATLSATGGSGTPYTWTVTSGTGLSAVGLTLSSAGVLTGTPTAEETSGAFTVKVTDSYGDTAAATLSLTIDYPVLTVTTASLPAGITGTAYTATLAASGGSKTGYTWAVTSGTSSLSAVGLSLSTSGVLSGATPIAGNATFTVQVTDSASNTATAILTLTIDSAVTITTTSLSSGTQGTTYTATLAASGGSGTGYTWAVTSGTGLSAVGLTLSSTGAITGTPNAGESATPFTVQVTDSNGNTATATFSLTVTSVVFQGQVLSGTQPIIGATIQLYTVGSTGNASAATPMLTQPVTTDALGMFNLTGFYTCGQSSTGQTLPGTAANTQVYLVATGGSTSATSSIPNAALVLVAPVGSCSNLTSTTTTPFFTLDELTTAAAAWALAPFSASAANIGASSTNTLGIANAFLDAALLANPATGAAATLPANLTIEAAKLNAFADVLNPCTAAGGSACTALFTAATPTGGTAPADTFTAALNIVHNPGQNVAAVYALIPTTPAPPFATTLTASPNDWTMSLTVTGGGLFEPTALGIDSQDNVWVANQNGPLSAFSPQGTPLSSTGFGFVSGVSIIDFVFGLAIDPGNNIWVTNQQGYGGGGNGSVTKFYGVNTPATTGTSPYPSGYSNAIGFPVALAADTNGDIFVANTSDSSATLLDNSGNVLSGSLGASYGLNANPNAIALDANHGFWLSGDTDVAHFSSSGSLLVNANCCQQSFGMATDAAGDLWIADYLGGPNYTGAIAEAVTDTSGNTSVPIQSLVTGGIDHPQMVAVDAAQNVWFTNRVNNSLTEIAGIANTLPVGTAISPSTGVHTTGGYGLDAALGGPFTLLPDRSGNLWVSNEGANTVTMFFGLAAPTATPLQPGTLLQPAPVAP